MNLNGGLYLSHTGEPRVSPADDAAGKPDGDGHRERNVTLADKLLVDVQLGAARSALTVGDVGFACHFELEAQCVTALRDGEIRFDVIELAPDIVVDVVELAVLDVEAETALDIASRQQCSFSPALGDFDIGGDAVRTVHHIGARIGRNHLRARVVGVARAIDGDLRARLGNPRHAATVDRQDVVLASLDVPVGDHLDQLRTVLGGEVVILGEVLGDVVQLPALRIQFDQLVLAHRRAEERARFFEAGPRPRTDRAPAFVVDRAMPHHLEVRVLCFEGASALSKACAKLRPSIGDCVTPLIEVGASMPNASSTVGTMSTA